MPNQTNAAYAEYRAADLGLYLRESEMMPIPRQEGPVTAGNSSVMADGACALVLTTRDRGRLNIHGGVTAAMVIRWES